MHLEIGVLDSPRSGLLERTDIIIIIVSRCVNYIISCTVNNGDGKSRVVIIRSTWGGGRDVTSRRDFPSAPRRTVGVHRKIGNPPRASRLVLRNGRLSGVQTSLSDPRSRRFSTRLSNRDFARKQIDGFVILSFADSRSIGLAHIFQKTPCVLTSRKAFFDTDRTNTPCSRTIRKSFSNTPGLGRWLSRGFAAGNGERAVLLFSTNDVVYDEVMDFGYGNRSNYRLVVS